MAHSSWGPGWPTCQKNKIVTNFSVDGISFPGGVRTELTNLLTRLVRETRKRGYVFGVPGNPSYGCWGFSCRAIAGTKKPSNHSWGLAVDINAPKNPYGNTLVTDMPRWMPELWAKYGFRWGGTYTGKKDAMHYEFLGSVQQCTTFTEVAIKNKLGEGSAVPTPPSPSPKPPTIALGTPTGWMNQAHPLVKQGDRNGTVGHLQVLLGTTVDNTFGPKTKGALMTRQKKEGIPADGICGDQSWGYIHPQIKQGSKGTYVKELQDSLKGCTADGDFGPNTKAHLVAFQKREKLTADGICGNKTWERLCVR